MQKCISGAQTTKQTLFMADRLKIYKNGYILPVEGNTDEGVRCYATRYEYNGNASGERSVTFSISVPSPIKWEIGDYAILRGEKFTLCKKPSCKKQARRDEYGAAFVYDGVKLEGIVKALTANQFLDYVPGDNNKHYTGLGTFSFYVEKVNDFASRVQANLERVYGEGEWLVEVKDDGEEFDAASFDVSSNTNLLKALNDFYGKFKQSFVVKTREAGYVADRVPVKGVVTLEKATNVITIGGVAEVTEEMIGYGKGRGMKSITSNTNDDKDVVTRGHFYGSTRNLPYRYYNKKYPEIVGDRYMSHLMLPLRYWEIGDSRVNDVFLDSITENFVRAGITDHEGMIKFNDDGTINKDSIKEGEKIFDSDDGDYKEIYPTLEDMTIDYTWEGMTVYDKNYIGTNDDVSVRSVCDKWFLEWKYCYHLLWDKTIIAKNYYEECIDSVIEGCRVFSEEFEKEVWDFTTLEYWFRNNFREVWSVDSKPDSFDISLKQTTNMASYIKLLMRLLGEHKFDDGGIVEDATHKLTLSDIEEIRENTFNKSGRLDIVTGSMRTTTGKTVEDNGIMGNDSSHDTNGKVIEPNVSITIPQIGFCIEDFVNQESNSVTISFKSGMCAGMEFTVVGSVSLADTNNYNKGWKVYIKREYNSTLNMYFPNKDFPINAGDEYVILGIDMPDVYVEAASNRLFKQSMRWLAENDHPRVVFTPQLDAIWLARNEEYADELREGMMLQFTDCDEGSDVADLGIGNAKVTITQLKIKYNDGKLPEYEVTLSDDPKQQEFVKTVNGIVNNNVAKVQKDVDNNSREIGASRAAMQFYEESSYNDFGDINEYLDMINDMFELVDYNEKKVIKANYDFFSVGDVAAFKFSETEPPHGVEYFRDLLDVIDAGNPSANQVWGWDGTKYAWLSVKGGASSWDEISDRPIWLDQYKTRKPTVGSWDNDMHYVTSDALQGYATESWVESKHYLTEHQSLADYAKKDEVVVSFGGQKGDISLRGALTQSGSVNLSMSGKELQASLVTEEKLDVCDLNAVTRYGKYYSLDNTEYANAPTQNFSLKTYQSNMGYVVQEFFSYADQHLYIRSQNYQDGDKVFQPWGKIALTTDTVAKANALAIPCSIWGQPFDGTGNVDGNITVNGFGSFSGLITVGNRQGNYTEYGAGYLELSYPVPYIDFHVNNSPEDYDVRIIGTTLEDNKTPILSILSDLVWVRTKDYGTNKAKLRIGDAVLEYDATNKALFIKDANEQTMNLVATGDVAGYSALGSFDSLTDLSLTDWLKVGNVRIENYKLKIDGFTCISVENENELYIGNDDDFALISIHGTTFTPNKVKTTTIEAKNIVNTSSITLNSNNITNISFGKDSKGNYMSVTIGGVTRTFHEG